MALSEQAFVAYPSEPQLLGQTIEAAAATTAYQLTTWAQSPEPGRLVQESVRERIDACSLMIADISVPNFNVLYEIGYAIGKRNPVVPIINKSLRDAGSYIRDLGILDTIIHESYTNSSDLTAIVLRMTDRVPIYTASSPHNYQQPCFLLDCLYTNEFVQQIVSAVKKVRFHYRSFDPREESRLSTPEAIKHISASAGVIIPLLSCNMADSKWHNLRAAFLAGLAHGMDKETLILQTENDPVPLDYRDFAVTIRTLEEVNECVSNLAERAFTVLEAQSPRPLQTRKNFLAGVDLGAAAAENEFRYLREYYVETYEFRRALQGEGRLVVGRKGSGKTAIFWQVRDRKRENRNMIVLDVKPETYQLRKFKEQVLQLLQEGAKEHTIMAIWEYMLYLEVCHKILENEGRQPLTDKYMKLDNFYRDDYYVSEGDFSERLSLLVRDIQMRCEKLSKGAETASLTQDEMTNLVYAHDVAELRRQVLSYIEDKDGLWILIDNIDKGWPSRGIGQDDAMMVRTLLEATRKVEKMVTKQRVEAHTLVFLRNDDYELVVEDTPDRGKEGLIAIDWTDADLLRQMLLNRFVFSGMKPQTEFFEGWPQICTRIVHHEESSQYLIDRCMMRPRFLIQLMEYCISNAVNKQRDHISEEDVDNGVYSFSMGIIKDIGYELRDVHPEFENVLYAFINSHSPLLETALKNDLVAAGFEEGSHAGIVDALLWYGVLGFMDGSEECYISGFPRWVESSMA